MSASRRTDRRTTRNHLSSPYKRPQSPPPKKSGWSLSGLFGFLNPLRSRNAVEPSEGEESESTSEDGYASEALASSDAPPPVAVQNLSKRGHELAQQQRDREADSSRLPTSGSESAVHASRSQFAMENAIDLTSPPRADRHISSLQTAKSPVENLEKVKRYLQDREDGRGLHQVEVIGLVSLLQGSVQDVDKDEPFRFSSSPTSDRGDTPFRIGSPGPSTSNTQTSRKTLAKNPNGVYRWQGAGSARPRNRYQSPAFGPPRMTPSKITLSAPQTPPKTDAKRRRVGPDASSPQRVQAPAPSPPPAPLPRAQPTAGPSTFPVSNGSSTGMPPANGSANGAAAAKSITPSTPRLRMVVPPKPTTPAVPSPLRQAWGHSDLPPSPPAHLKQPTRAATLMEELIKEAAPQKKSDVANPYQEGSPVRPPAKKSTKKRKTSEERKQKEKEKEEKERERAFEKLSPQRMVEATVPRGMKRARPPPDLVKTASPPKANGINQFAEPRRSTRLTKSTGKVISNGANEIFKDKATAPVIEEQPDEEDERPSPKKQKQYAVTIEEVEDVDMPRPATRTAEIIEPMDTSSPSSAFTPQSAPISKPAPPPNSNSHALFGAKPAFGLKSSAPKEPSKLRFGFAAETEEKPAEAKVSAPVAVPVPPSKASSYLSTAQTTVPKRGPSSKPSIPAPAPPASFTLKGPAPTPVSAFTPPPAPKLSHSALPTSESSAQPTTSTSTVKLKVDSKDTARAIRGSALPSFSFIIPTQISQKHNKERDAAKAIESTSLPAFKFSWDTKDVDAVASSGATASMGAPFNWAAAGMKAPAKVGGTWTCSLCDLSNPDSAQDCTVCEAKRPSAALKPASGGFNWAAAGMKAPAKAGGTWTCSLCSLSNPNSVTECTVCEAKRP